MLDYFINTRFVFYQQLHHLWLSPIERKKNSSKLPARWDIKFFRRKKGDIVVM